MTDYMIEPVSHSVARAALVADVSERTIRQAIADGDLGTHPLGKKHLILHTELIAWVESL